MRIVTILAAGVLLAALSVGAQIVNLRTGDEYKLLSLD